MEPGRRRLVQRLRDALGVANLLMVVVLLIAIRPTAWMLAVWGILAGVAALIVTGIILFRIILETPPPPQGRGHLLRRAFPPLAAGLSFVILAVQGADLEVRETTERQDYWLLSAAMVLAVFTMMVSYDRSRPKRD